MRIVPYADRLLPCVLRQGDASTTHTSGLYMPSCDVWHALTPEHLRLGMHFMHVKRG